MSDRFARVYDSIAHALVAQEVHEERLIVRSAMGEAIPVCSTPECGKPAISAHYRDGDDPDTVEPYLRLCTPHMIVHAIGGRA